jgi:hypothetical protein
MAPKKTAPKSKAKPLPLPPMGEKKGTCGVDGYCCQGKSPEDCCGGQCGGSCGGNSKASIFDCHILALMKKRAFWLGSIMAFFSIALFQYAWHDIVMMPRYVETASLWRPMAEIAANSHLFLIHHALMAVVFTIIFLLMGGYGLLKGTKNGVLIASPLAICCIGAYASQPIPADVVQMWALGYLLQGAILGVVLSIITSCGWCSNTSQGCCGGQGGGSCSTDGKGCC